MSSDQLPIPMRFVSSRSGWSYGWGQSYNIHIELCGSIAEKSQEALLGRARGACRLGRTQVAELRQDKIDRVLTALVSGAVKTRENALPAPRASIGKSA